MARKELSAVLEEVSKDAERLHRTGNKGQAEYVDSIVRQIIDAGEDFVTWLSEPEAKIRSGLEERTLRSRFRWLRSCGLARYGVKGRREYLACGIPQRSTVLESFNEGLRSA